MQALINLAKRVQKVDEIYLMRQLFKDKEFLKLIIDLNTKDQLYDQGIDSEGNALKSAFARFGEVYADRTINIKQEKGQPTDRVTLKDTGKFYKSFKVRMDSNHDLEITANVIKEDTNLAEVWGEDIIGLTKENLQFVIDQAREIIVPIIRDKILQTAA